MKTLLILILSLSITITAFGQQSNNTTTAKIDSSKLFIVDISTDSLVVRLSNKLTKLSNLNQLDDFIKTNISQIVNEACYLVCNHKRKHYKVKDITALFSKYNMKNIDQITY